MTEKRSIMLLASAAVLTLALQESATSAPAADAPASPTTEQAAGAEPTTPAAGQGSTQEPAPAAQESTTAVESGPASSQVPAPAPSEQPAAVSPHPPTPPARVPAEAPVAAPAGPAVQPEGQSAARGRMEQRRAELAEERARRYEEMRSRAAEHGLEFPQEPPWQKDAGQPPQLSAPPTPPEMAWPGTPGAQPPGMTSEERDAEREGRYQNMRERAMQRRQEKWERWDSYWKILDAMTPEQKEAIEAVFGRAHRRFSPRAMGPQMSPGMPMQPHMGHPDQGFPSGSAFPGYGYGPQGGEPYMHEWGPASSWFGQQPMPPGGAQPWYGGEQGSFQGPPPPGADQAQP